MQNQENLDADGKAESVISIQTSEYDSWGNLGDDDIMLQKSAIFVQEAEKVPFVGDKACFTQLSFSLLHCPVLILPHFFPPLPSRVCVIYDSMHVGNGVLLLSLSFFSHKLCYEVVLLFYLLQHVWEVLKT